MPNRLILISRFLLFPLLITACSRLSPIQLPESTYSPSPTSITTLQPTLVLTPTTAVVQGTVRIWHSWNEDAMPALTQIIAGFNTRYPDVLFDVLYVPSQDMQARFAAEAGDGHGPSLLLAPAEWGPGFFDAGLVQDLSTLASQETLNSLNQPALGEAQYKEALVGLPYAMRGIVMFRNKDIITIPANTFDELVTLAQTSTIGETVGSMLERSLFYSGGHLEGIGGELMDPQGYPAFNNEKGLEWIELLRSFEQAGPTDYLTDQDLDYFKNERIGWVIDGTWNLNDLAQAIGPDKLAIDPWPSYNEGQLAGYVLADNLYLNSNVQGDDLLATGKFIEYFLSPEAQTRLAEVGMIPTANEVTIDDPVNGPLITQTIAALAGGVTYPVSPLMTLYNINLDVALRSIFEEGMDPKQALQTAEDAILAGMTQENAVSPTAVP